MNMKVLQICSYYSRPLYKLLFDALKMENSLEQTIFYFATSTTVYNADENNVVFAPCYSQFDRVFFRHKENKVLKELYKLESIDKYDLVHAHSLFANGYIAYKLKKGFNTPYIVAVRNTDVNSFFEIRPWLRKIGVDILLEAQTVIFLSEAYRRKVLNQYVPEKFKTQIEMKSMIIPNGINETFLNSTPEQPRMDDGTIRVIQVGEVNRNKNQLATAKACEILQKDGHKILLKVIGKCSDQKYCRMIGKFSFVNYLETLPQNALIGYYRDSDLFVMPSRHETFGLSYVEAMSQGLPVIYTKNEGFDCMFPEGLVGCSVNADDVEGIADAIMYCYSHRKSMFNTCIEMSNKFNWSAIAKLYNEIYKTAII